ncbi:hypothetical protein AHMF7605_10380 [Adhaeribacter arboris]|uniref:Uncharacterized protein n=1 Tax=Adhaeribacter arboris TaxID=2072846 RepID=A0A2T2YEG0_9BACT|nr:hypothetical protein [Adhaeribacter arboris]PSR53894.1 hypothetical protein AHMF7605_10380 [Adhaeribacter arboris]
MAQYILNVDQKTSIAIQKQLGLNLSFQRVELISIVPKNGCMDVVVATDDPTNLFTLGFFVGGRIVAGL